MEELNSDGLPILKGNKNVTADGLPILKKKAQSVDSSTGGVGSVPGLEAFQQFKPGVNKYVRQPAPVAPGIRNQGQAPKTVAQAQKEKPVPFSQEAFKQAAPQGISPSTANRMGAITSTASGFYRIPELIYSTFAAPQNLAADILDKPELRANYDAISKGTYNPLGVIDKTADYLQQSSVDWEKNKTKYNENITTQLMNGDFQGAARQIGDQIESSIPGMLSMYVTGPLAAAGKFAPTARTLTMAAPFAGSQLNEIKDNPNIPDYLKPINAWLNGTAEVVLEEQFGTKALVDDMLRVARTEGREAAVNTIKNVLRPLGERFIKKVQPVTNVLGNGLEEGITTFSQNVVDKYTGVDPNRGLLDNVPDSIIVGTAQGTGVTALSKGMDVLTNPKNQVKIDTLSKQRDDLMNDLDSPSIPDNIKGDLVDKLTDINEEINIVLDENRAEYDALSDDDIGTLKTLNDQIDDRVDLLNNTSLSETSRQLAQNDLAALQKDLAAKQKEVSSKVEQFKTQTNAVQKPSTTSQVPPVIKGGQVVQEGGEGVGQGVEGTQAPQEAPIQEPTAEIVPEEVTRLREQEQAEYAAMDNPNDEVKRAEIYDRYDKLITPLIRESKQVEVTTPQPSQKVLVSGVKYTVPTIEEQDALKSQRTDKAYFDAKVNELPSSPLTSEQVDEVLTNGKFGILTGQNPMGQPVPDAVNNKLNAKAKKWLKSKGYSFFDVAGKYGQTEGSLLVPDLSTEDAIEFAKEFNQESVVTNDGLVYQDGSMNPRVKEEDSFTVDVSKPDTDFASAIKLSDGSVKGFSLGLNFDETINTPKAEQPVVETIAEEAVVEEQAPEEKKETTIRNAEVEAKRAEYGFPEPTKQPYQSNEQTLEKAKQAIKDGVSVNEVIEKALNREPITDVESAMLSLYQGTKEAELLKANSELEQIQSSSALDFTDAVDKRNKIIDELINAYNASEASGNVSARALQARKIKVLQDDSLANMLIQKRKANNNRKLTNKQVDDITKLYTKMKATKALLEIKIEKLNEENAQLKLKAVAPKIVKEVKAESTGKTKEQLKAEREDIFKQMSELARKSRATMSVNPIPVEMIPLVVKLAKNYLATGAKTLDEVIDKVHADLSGYIENVSKNDIRRTLSDYDADTRPTKEDIQDEVFGERSKEKQIKDIEDLEKQARKEKDPEAAQLLQDEANAKRTAMEKQAEKDGLDKEQSRLDNYKKNIQKRIDELQGKLKKGDYAKTPKNEIKLDDEARKLKKQLEDIKFKFAIELEKDALKSRNQLEKAVDVVVEVSNTPRALMATADFSAPLRQGVVATVAYPDIAAKAANEMMVQWASSEKAEQWMDDLIESPGYRLMKDAGLYIANIRSAKLSAKEEDFATNLASKIPGAGKLVDASERAYVAYLNKMRVDIFNQGVELLQNDGYSFATNPKAYKTLANYVNAVTGRGSLGGGALEKAGPALNALMFSPRLLASRIRLLTMLADPRIYKKENRVIRNMYLKDMSRFVGFGLSVLALAALAGAEVEDDPRSTDFGKIKVGDTRWDIWGGFQQPIRAFVQATLEERKSTTTGKIVKLDGSGYGGETGGDVLLRFFRGKLAPVPAFLVNAYTGKDVMGTPFELGPAVLQMSYPLVIQSVVESAKKDGIVFGVLATGVPSLLGVGVQTYGANDFLKQGVDDKSINLLLSKKAIAIEPNELDTKVFDVNTGEDRKMSDEEFKKYYAEWADYIKMKLRDNYNEYKDMSVDEFETEFRSIKSEATKLAKENISGVSNTTKTISYREDDESESYKLTPEELKYRQSLNEQYISRHGNIYNKEFKNAIRNGKSEEEADIIAKKRLTSKANEYSRKIILKQHKSGRGYDF